MKQTNHAAIKPAREAVGKLSISWVSACGRATVARRSILASRRVEAHDSNMSGTPAEPLSADGYVTVSKRSSGKRSRWTNMKSIGLAPVILVLAGCSDFLTDGATRIAYDIESGSKRIGQKDGEKLTIEHHVKARPEGCSGDYHVEFVQAPGDTHSIVGIWCMANGKTAGSHTTSYHSRFVSLEQTFRLDKNAGEPLFIDIQRKQGQLVITNVY
jgi:hypothetical protein